MVSDTIIWIIFNNIVKKNPDENPTVVAVSLHFINKHLENSRGENPVRLVSAGSWETQREDFNDKCEVKQIETGEEQKDTIRFNKTEVFEELEPIADLRGGRRLRKISGFWTTHIIGYLLVLAGGRQVKLCNSFCFRNLLSSDSERLMANQQRRTVEQERNVVKIFFPS